MIRLIAADMDGTLLNDDKQLPPDWLAVFRRLLERGVRIAAASGRQYYNLRTLLAPLQEDLAFISTNGTLLFYRGENLLCREISVIQLLEVLNRARKLHQVHAVCCGVKSSYCDSRDRVVIRQVRLAHEKVAFVPDLQDFVQRGEDRICQISLYDGIGAEKNSYPALRLLENQFHVVLSGSDWLDFLSPGTSKGSALQALQRHWGIAPEETMAFGDYLNDREMIQACAFGYAMENAHPGLKAVTPFRAPSNNEQGVMQILKQTFFKA